MFQTMDLPVSDGGSLRVMYKEEGTGDPMVVIPGMSMRCEPYVEFASKSPRPVVMFYQRDISPTSARASYLHSCFDVARDLHQVLLHLDIRKTHLVGESFGGMVALAYALKHEASVQKIVLVSSQIAGQPVMPLVPTSVAKFMLKRLSFTNNIYRLLAEMIFAPDTVKNEPDRVDQFVKLHAGYRFPERAVIKQAVAALRFWVAEDLKHLKHPVLLLCGGKDQLVPIKHSSILREKLPLAMYHRHEEGGHSLLTEKPNFCAEFIEHFLHP
jgi:3-oxoadipate enol-lactonase